MSQQLYSSDKFIQIKFPDGHKHQILCQQDIRNLKLKICCMNHILYFENQLKYHLTVFQYLIQPKSKSLMFKNITETGHEYEVIDLRKYISVQKRNQDYERELSYMRQYSSNEVEFLKQQIQKLNDFIAQITHQQNSTDLEWKQKYEELFIENQQLMDKIQAQATQIDQLNVKVYEQKQELQDKDSEILICNINLEDCQQSNERLIESLQNTKEDVSLRENKLKACEIELTKLNHQIQQFQVQSQQQQQHFAYQQQQFAKEQQSYIQKIEELEENINTQQAQLKREKSYRNQFLSDFEAKVEEINLLNLQVEKKNAEIKEKLAQIQSLKIRLNDSESYFQKILQEHQNQISSQNQSIQQYKQKLEKVQNELQQLKTIIQGSNQTLPKQIVVPSDDTIKKLNDQKFQDINDDLKLQIETLEHSKLQLEQKLTQKESESQLLDQKLKISYRKNEDLQSTIEQKEKEVNLAKQNLILLEQQHIQKLKEIVDQNQKEVSEFNQKIKTIQQQLESKNQELQQVQTNLNEQIKKLIEQFTNNKNEIKIRDDKIIKLNQQINGTIHFKWRIDRLVENMYDTKVYIGSNKDNLSIEKFLMENQPINNCFTKETIEIKFQVLKINLEVNQLKQKIYQDSNLEFTNCFNFAPQGEIEGIRTKIRTTESNVDRIYFYQCKSGILKDKVLIIREYIKMPQNMDQEIQHMIKQGGASPVSQFLMEEFYQLIHESKERIEYHNQLSGQKLLIPEKFQFQEQFLLKQHDDARNIDRYYNAWVINAELKNNRYDFNRLNGGHKFVNNSDIAIFLQVFSFFTIWRTNRQLAVTYIQGIENQLFDPIVSTYDGFFNILDQGNLEIKTFESLFRSSKNNYKAEQLLKCLNINL